MPEEWRCASGCGRGRSCTTRCARIVGTLERVGAGAWPPERVAEALAARDRAACGPVAPPDGLYLVAVRYPDDPFDAADGAVPQWDMK